MLQFHLVGSFIWLNSGSFWGGGVGGIQVILPMIGGSMLAGVRPALTSLSPPLRLVTNLSFNRFLVELLTIEEFSLEVREIVSCNR